MGVPVAYYAEVHFGDEKIVVHLSDTYGRKYHIWKQTRHVTSDYELHVILDGSAELILKDGKKTVSNSQAVIIAPNVPHASESGQEKLTHFCVHFSAEGERMKEALQCEVSDCVVFPIPQDAVTLVRDLLQELIGAEVYRQELIKSLLPPLIIKIFRAAGILVDHSKVIQQDDALGRRFIIETFFKAQMPHGKSEERLARELGLSRRQLARVLQENYGMNFREMLLHSRMEHAAWMLRSTDLPVGEIAEKLKYTSVSAFSQTFRARYQMTPTQYRKTNR